MSSLWTLAPSARLLATAEGVVFSGDKKLRIDLGNRSFERELVQILADGRSVDPLVERYSSESVDRALNALREAGAIVPWVPLRIVRLHREDPPRSIESTRPVIILCTPDDDRIDTFLGAIDGAPLLVIWLDRHQVIAVQDDRRARPCVRCALLFDAEAHQRALPSRLISEAPPVDLVASADTAIVEPVAEALALRMARGGEWPPCGTALVIDTHAWTTMRASVPAHPACSCAREDRAPLPSAPIDPAEPRRFGPLIFVEPTRVLFRRSRSPWPLRAADFGAATASGANAKERALAEAIERFAMHHAPPDRKSVPARELGSEALDEASIRTLLFRDEERGRPGFRLARYDRDLALDWSWGVSLGNGERRLIPTCLVGRVGDGPILVDASSNGYAAHTEQEQAIVAALLEVVERDAVLFSWYLDRDLPRIEVGDASELEDMEAKIAVFLATHAIDLPVVWILAELQDGSIRSASAAALSFDEALARASRELLAATNRPSQTSDPDLFDVSRRFGPSDHLHYYSSPERCGPVCDRMRATAEASISQLRRRWPPVAPQAALPTILRALDGAGHRDAWVVDRSLPSLFGPSWRVVRALVPGTIEISWGQAYRRLAAPSVRRALDAGHRLSPWPHPIS